MWSVKKRIKKFKRKLFEWNYHSLGKIKLLRPLIIFNLKCFFFDHKHLHLIKEKLADKKKILILGNAENLNRLNPETLQFLSKDYLVIGLNRACIKYPCEITMWSDNKAILDIYDLNAIKNSNLFIKVSYNSLPRKKNNTKFWYLHKSFKNWDKPYIFMSRNIFTAALFFAYFMKIKEIDFIGIDLETRNYFLNNVQSFTPQSPYEINSQQKILRDHFGYDSQKIVKEIIEYLIAKENFKITSYWKNNFLSTIQGLKFKD